jgi:signal transduction histidine kinase/CheY-like chemotaxis protein
MIPRLSHLHRRLLALVTVAMLPIALLSLFGLVALAQQQRADIERRSLDTVRALTTAVDNELRLSIAAAETLAATWRFNAGDLKAFHKSARDVMLIRGSWETIVLANRSGQQIVNLRHPLGTPLSGIIEKDSFDRVVRTRMPTVGGIVKGPTGDLLFPVRVPVISDGEVLFVIGTFIRPQAMSHVIEQQKLPSDSVVSVFDPNGRIVMRSRNHDKYLGTPVSPSLVAMMREGGSEGYGQTLTLEGLPVYTAYARSALSGWGIALGTPTAPVDAALRHSYLLLGAGILLSLVLGACLAIVLAGRITAPLRLLRTAALADDGKASALPKDTLPEVEDVSKALATAARLRSRADAQREHQLRRERAARESAEDSNRLKDEFLAMLGHELRNPLAAISSAAQVLAARCGRDEIALNASQILSRQTRHLARLMDDLLDVGRVMAGKIALDRRTLDLADAARQAVSTLRAAGMLDRHRFSLCAEPAWVHADGNRIEQIVTNLLANALKYTPRDGKVSLAVEQRGGEAVLCVTDDGIGMDAELRPRVFDLFVQGRQALHRAQGGLGIGLTLVRRLVEMHGGSVTADSPGEGRGSSFTVRLPLAAAPEAFIPAVPSVSMAPAARPCRVLLVEDNDDARSMMRSLLAAEGHDVCEAADGSLAIAAAETTAFDIAFVDVGLPTVDGYEVARRLRAIERAQRRERMRLVAVTGYGQPGDRANALAAGFDLHLVKPVEPEVLRAAFTGMHAPEAAAAGIALQ